MYVLEWRIVSAPTIGLFWCLFPELRSNEGNKYQNNTWVSAETVLHESTYIILFLTRHNKSINEYKTTSCTHRSCVSLARFSFCWWSHNRLLMRSQWPDDCDAIAWIMISNSLDIDYIHGDIHGQCKNVKHLCVYFMTYTVQIIDYWHLGQRQFSTKHIVAKTAEEHLNIRTIFPWKHAPIIIKKDLTAFHLYAEIGTELSVSWSGHRWKSFTDQHEDLKQNLEE